MKKTIVLKSKFLVMMLCLTAIFCGCSQTSRHRATHYINHNMLLNQEERSYAIRFYDLINSEKFYDEKPAQENVTIDPNLFGSELYKKWGLGQKADLSYEEKLYIGKLEEIADLWDEYKTVLSNLTDSEREYLKDVHVKYGPGPINLREIITKTGDPLTEMEDKMMMQTLLAWRSM